LAPLKFDRIEKLLQRYSISRQSLQRSAGILAIILTITLIVPIFSVINSIYAAANSINTVSEQPQMDDGLLSQFIKDDINTSLSNSDAQMVFDADSKLSAFLSENTEPIETADDGIINILLIGCDSNEYTGYLRSDSMMILSINPDKGTVKLISLMRDMRVLVNGSYEKLNAAFAYDSSGQLLLDTIEKNFLIDIDDFICINYRAFRNAVDALGGVRVPVEEGDIKAINKCISNEEHHLTHPGEQLLNGTQTLAYCQMRAVGTDVARTARQRIVMTELIRMAQDMSFSDLTEIIEATMPNVLTNMSQGELFWLALKAVGMDSMSVEQMRIPLDNTWQDVIVDQRWYISFDLEKNVNALHEMIYGDPDEPSSSDTD